MLFSMFGMKKKDEVASTTPTALAPNSVNSLVKGTEIKGEIKSATDIRIDGIVHGTVTCDAKVIIGPSGFIEGSIVCKNAVIEGRMEGNIKVAEVLHIRKTGQVNGEILTGKVIMESGAAFNGICKMGNQEVNTTMVNNTITNNTIIASSNGTLKKEAKAS